MKAYRIVLARSAEKGLRTLPKKDQRRVMDVVALLASDPFLGKQLQGEFEGQWSIRVWPYRIVYTIERQIVTVTILRIGHRKDIYK